MFNFVYALRYAELILSVALLQSHATSKTSGTFVFVHFNYMNQGVLIPGEKKSAC